VAGRPAGAGRQGIAGRLSRDGRPLAGASVYAYRSSARNFLGPADFASEPSLGDGTYFIDLVSGSYYVLARKRQSGGNSGPLTTGDLHSLNPLSPVAVPVTGVVKLDLELKILEDPMLLRFSAERSTEQGVRGVIVDGEGRPVPWVFAMAYDSSDMKRMPDHTSTMTGTDGSFVIYLPAGGRYWLSARKNIREKPLPGEPFGLYEGSADHSVDVDPGAFVANIRIRLQPYRKGMGGDP